VIWRLRILNDILHGRRASFDTRIRVGIVAPDNVKKLEEFLNRIRIWVVLASPEDKAAVQGTLTDLHLEYKTELFSLSDVESELSKIGN
jgi:hypothetical protein